MDGPDEETLDFIIRMQQSEVDRLLVIDGIDALNHSDELIALQASLDELTILKTIYSDRRLALELSLSTHDPVEANGHDPNEPGNNSTQSLASCTEPAETQECTVCFESSQSTEVIIAPCQDVYCINCLRNLFESSFRDESLFPPRCCRQVIPIESVEDHFSSEMVQIYHQKSVEFSTPNRTYCHNPQCSTFISPGFIFHDAGLCKECHGMTCTRCKLEWHGGDCPEDTALQQVLELAAEQGWQRCPSCRTMVELKHGCNHMTCVCSHEFCYQCAAPWKTCNCPQWVEELLIQQAEQLVERDNVRQDNREHVVEAAAAMLMERHECQHTVWTTVPGRFTCEICDDRLPYFINECTQCRILMCRRCRDHRLR